jgi:hypothetical protein
MLNDMWVISLCRVYWDSSDMAFLRDWFNEGGCVIKVYIREWA